MKKILALVLAAMMVLSLSACAKPAADTAPATEAAKEAAAETQAKVEEAVAEAIAEDGVPGDINGDGVIKVGLNLCMPNNIYWMVWDSVGDLCANQGWELVTPTIGMNDKIIENDRTLLSQGIDVLIDFGCNEEYQNGARELCDEAGVFVIGVDVSSGGNSSFIGANNEKAGIVLGESLAGYVEDNWDGQCDWVFVSYAELNGEVVKLRTHGTPKVFLEKGLIASEDQVYYLDKQKSEEIGEAFKNFLVAHPDDHHIVAVSVTEEQGPYLAAAAESIGRSKDVVIGTNSESNVFIDYQRDFPDNPWWCTVAYSFEKYGDLCLEILDKKFAGEEPPKEVLMDHEIIDQTNFENWAWLSDYTPKYAK